MARLPTTKQRRYLLADRFGLRPSRALAGLVVLIVAVLASFAWLRVQQTQGVTIERASSAEARLGDQTAEELASTKDARAENTSAQKTEGKQELRQIVVHVDGAVVAPGVYSLAEGARANDAVAAAGGLTETADTQSLNLAGLLTDGQKLHVPAQGEALAVVGANSGGPTGGASQELAGPININSADVAMLERLPGVGKATAEAIVAERQNNGPFASVDELTRVSGIGERKLERLRGSVCV